MVPFGPFLAALGIAQTFGLALLSLAQEVVQILVVWIKCRLVHDLIAELTPESGKSRTTGGVIVKIALDNGIVSQWRYGFGNIGNRIENYRIHTVVEAEAFSRKEVDETLEDIAPDIAVGNKGDMLRRIRPFEERVAQLIAVGVILKADGVIPFAV